MTGNKILTWKDLWDWMKSHFTRKFTVPFHLMVGAACAVAMVVPIRILPGSQGIGYQVAGVIAFLGFLIFEHWQAQAENDHGHLDYYDCLFAFIAALVILLIMI